MSRVIVSLSIAAVVLTGCTAPGGLPLPGAPGAPAAAKVEIQQGRAPSAIRDQVFLRADEVTRQGSTVSLGLTIATAGTTFHLDSWSIKIATNAGVAVPVHIPDRELPSNARSAVSLSVPLPEGTRELTVKMTLGPEIRIPIPESGAFIWPAAPLRQVGLAPVLQRNKRAELTLDAVRSAGIVTDVEFHAAGLNGDRAEVCAHYPGCALAEADGTVHPLLEFGERLATPDGRIRGTLRFLGDLGPDSTELTLDLVSDATLASRREPVQVTLPVHADSPSVPAAGDASRASADMKVTATSPESGATVLIDRVDVLADHIQVHLRGTGGREDFPIASFVVEKARLIEPSGVEHALIAPAASDIVVRAGTTLDATLAFQGSLPTDVTTLAFEVPGRVSWTPLRANLPLSAATRATPPAGATLGEVAASPALPEPSRTATSVAPAPSGSATPSVALMGLDITPLQISTETAFAVVRSTIKGSAPTSATASGAEVDAQREAKAQRSLEDLGAQHTPDGWVLTLPETVLFDYNKADVKPDAAGTIAKVADLLSYYDKATIGVQGHTDSTGDAAANLELSKRRAQAVADALASRGIGAARMRVEGLGLSRPVASNASDEGRAKNRRVEIVLRDKG